MNFGGHKHSIYSYELVIESDTLLLCTIFTLMTTLQSRYKEIGINSPKWPKRKLNSGEFTWLGLVLKYFHLFWSHQNDVLLSNFSSMANCLWCSDIHMNKDIQCWYSTYSIKENRQKDRKIANEISNFIKMSTTKS